MIPEPSFEAPEAFVRPFIDLTILGEGFHIENKAIALNPNSPTKVRFTIEGGNPIERYAVEAEVYEGKLANVSAHTWNEEGHHLNLFEAQNLSDGEVYEKDVEILKDGVLIALEVRLKYYVK